MIEKIWVETEAWIIDQNGNALFTTEIAGKQIKIFDLIFDNSPKGLQEHMKPEIFSNMVELFTGAGNVESIKKEAAQLREWLEETTNKLWLILSRNSVYPVNISNRDWVLSREEIYKESFDRVRKLNPDVEFGARTLWLHVHMSCITDQATMDLLFSLNNFYADIWLNDESENRLSNPNILMSKERFKIRKPLVETRNKLWEKHGWFFPIKFNTKTDLFETFFAKDITNISGDENIPNLIESHRIITLKKPGEQFTVEDRHADCPSDAKKITQSIDIIINNAKQALNKNSL